MLFGVQYCLWVLRWLNYIVLGSFHTIGIGAFVQDEFRTTTTSVALWQKSIVSILVAKRTNFGWRNREVYALVSSCEWPPFDGATSKWKISSVESMFVVWCVWYPKIDSCHSLMCEWTWRHKMQTENLIVGKNTSSSTHVARTVCPMQSIIST